MTADGKNFPIALKRCAELTIRIRLAILIKWKFRCQCPGTSPWRTLCAIIMSALHSYHVMSVLKTSSVTWLLVLNVALDRKIHFSFAEMEASRFRTRFSVTIGRTVGTTRMKTFVSLDFAWAARLGLVVAVNRWKLCLSLPSPSLCLNEL